MSASDTYFKTPLSILRSGGSALEALCNALCCGTVNAGIGFRKLNGEEAFACLLEETANEAKEPESPPADFTLTDACNEAMSREDSTALWQAALVGAGICNLKGATPEYIAQCWAKHGQETGVFFTIKGHWLWNALHSERKKTGWKVDAGRKPLSWREFRILAAILSVQTNQAGFAFIGWETIQARACGYHRKDLLAASWFDLPPHCQPLSRAQIRTACQNLEALGFFARVRYSTGPRGGYLAYSFRHPRPALIEAVKLWKQQNNAFALKAATHRAEDLAAFRAAKGAPSSSQGCPKHAPT
ncbi:hypothetical protein WJU23_00315 [Prosthecobacter sp. SYSU 5D2]|uniref:hypothetical protein n=1 Tax=Prosthecobacter sp. SYSU 5D2 TaxID=3134134 RepID=UPI0031FF156B